jgi:protein-S-isoprenylcysteine O-methyltransferase Ste14
MFLQGAAYALLWQGKFWEQPLPAWRLVFAGGWLVLASALSWSGARALGRQWRIDAALSAEHQLVMAGPYRIIRHPIYASMMCLLLGTGLMLTPWRLFLLALAFFLTGTEIRVRIEERLLAARFGESFRDYQRSVPAYIPLVR